MKHKLKRNKILAIPVVLVLLGLYYYIALPAINIHNASIWKFIIAIPVIIFILYILPKISLTGNKRKPVSVQMGSLSLPLKLCIAAIILLAAVYLGGTLLSSPVINASKYQKLMTVEKGEFSEDIHRFPMTRFLF